MNKFEMNECALNKCGNEGMWNMKESANDSISNMGMKRCANEWLWELMNA